MKIMFLDESGDHSLSKIDPQYPMFVLGGIIVEQDYAEGELTAQVRQFKNSSRNCSAGTTSSCTRLTSPATGTASSVCGRLHSGSASTSG